MNFPDNSIYQDKWIFIPIVFQFLIEKNSVVLSKKFVKKFAKQDPPNLYNCLFKRLLIRRYQNVIKEQSLSSAEQAGSCTFVS